MARVQVGERLGKGWELHDGFDQGMQGHGVL